MLWLRAPKIPKNRVKDLNVWIFQNSFNWWTCTKMVEFWGQLADQLWSQIWGGMHYSVVDMANYQTDAKDEETTAKLPIPKTQLSSDISPTFCGISSGFSSRFKSRTSTQIFWSESYLTKTL